MIDTLYKLVDGQLISTSTMKEIIVDGKVQKVYKSDEELEGWKPYTIEARETFPNLYQIEVEEIVEYEYRISKEYRIIDKPLEEIVAINETFWEENYLYIHTTNNSYVVPRYSYMGEEKYKLLQDDLPVMLVGAISIQMEIGMIMADTTLTQDEKNMKIYELQTSPTRFNKMEMYNVPNMEEKVDIEYLNSLKVVVSDTIEMTEIMSVMASQLYLDRTLPTVI